MVYRKAVVFAALPRTRALFEEDAILLKFNRQPRTVAARIAAEPRFAAGTMEQRRDHKKSGGQGRHWRIFLMRDVLDLHAFNSMARRDPIGLRCPNLAKQGRPRGSAGAAVVV